MLFRSILLPALGLSAALLAACGSRAGEYAGVTTFSKLTEDVLERTGALPETLDDGGRVLTMHRALTAARPGLTYYRKAGRPQLTARLVELAGELQSCAVTPEMLLRAEEAGPKIRDLGLIYGEYLRLCREGRLDPSQRIDLARERLEASGLVQGAHVFIRGFEGFTAQKRAMVEAILAQAADMTVLLEWEPGNPIYAEQRQTCVQLRRMADGRGIPFREETLSAREEREALAAMAAGDESARNRLIEHNLRLVVYIAKKFDNTSVGVEDLISIGTIGLIKAINTFNPTKNIKLATYASRCIENEILMYLRRTSKMKLEVSIDEPLNVDWDGNELLLSDILGTEEDVIYKDMEDEVEKDLLKKAVSRLSPRERKIVELRYGLKRRDGAEMTQKEVADLMGISQSYISRLEKKIMMRLKKEIVKFE